MFRLGIDLKGQWHEIADPILCFESLNVSKQVFFNLQFVKTYIYSSFEIKKQRERTPLQTVEINAEVSTVDLCLFLLM
jgi:hypothetical protein